MALGGANAGPLHARAPAVVGCLVTVVATILEDRHGHQPPGVGVKETKYLGRRERLGDLGEQLLREVVWLTLALHGVSAVRRLGCKFLQ